MCKKLLAVLLLSILVASALVGCDGGEGSPCPSTLTILSVTEGEVYVMKEGTDDWVNAGMGVELTVGDGVKTGGNSSAEIAFFDGSTMELQAGTEIKILSLDIVCDTSVSTITLEQTIGTTISRVTKLLDPGSSYEIETPTGVAGVRGTTVKVTVGGNGTTFVTNKGGVVYAVWEGMELPVPVGQTLIFMEGQSPNFMPLAEDDTAITDEDNPVTVAAPGVLNNDSDLDVGDTLTVASVDTSGTVGVITAWNADGSFTYDPDEQFEYLQAGSSTTDSFSYMVSDGYGGNDAAAVTITINGVNDPPVAVNDSAITKKDTSVIVDVLSNDSDLDSGDILTVHAVTQATNGSVSNNGSYVTYTPATGFNGTDSFSYTVSDGNGGTNTATVNVTVVNAAIIYVHVDVGPTASILIWDDTTGGWAIDLDTQELVDGTNHATSGSIDVVAGHYYYVWVEAPNNTFQVLMRPCGWVISSAPVGDSEAAYGYAATGYMNPVIHPVHFTIE
ncbi:MAG: tandem-95 repeat protein [Chloroflexota bacterium]|nr:MAG: tandem-95 repeat protein [Chloroflexota bacterium]